MKDILSEVNWLAVTIAFPIGFIGTVVMRKVANHFEWLAHPGPGRIHRRAVPQIGGIAIMVGFIVAAFIAVPLDFRTMGMLLGAVVAVGVGLVDDFRDLKPREKLVAQIVAATIPVAFGIQIDGVSSPFGGILFFPTFLVIPFTIIWITGMMNAINFLDGVDGLASGVVTIGTVVLVVLSMQLGQPLIATIGLALIAATLGFLPFNFFRASIFLGDSGTHLLGYTIAVLAIIGGAKIATALLVLGIPVLDLAWAIIRRWRAGSAVTRRDTDHLHHRLLRAGIPQPVVVVAYYSVSAGFGLIALYLDRLEKLIAFAGMAALMVVILFVLARTDPGDCLE